VLTRFDNTTKSQHDTDDSSFTTLGMVLVELCFGRLGETHTLWPKPAFSQGINPSLIRKAVASEWQEDVIGEARTDYANAVH